VISPGPLTTILIAIAVGGIVIFGFHLKAVYVKGSYRSIYALSYTKEMRAGSWRGVADGVTLPSAQTGDLKGGKDSPPSIGKVNPIIYPGG
jgi:hypothetical protein